MALFETSFIRKPTLFLAVAMISLSAAAAHFNQTQHLANQGNAIAQHNLGVAYANGEGVSQDYTKAVEWYKKAASQGYTSSQFNLGNAYYNGTGVRQDYVQARQWYEKAANQGLVEAQTNLGIIYANGEGVRQSKGTAKKWFGKACDNGYQSGCDYYQMLNQD